MMTKTQMAEPMNEVQRLTVGVAMLRTACGLALAWLENMRIVPGGERARLRDALRMALDATDPEKAGRG